jgi:prepilin-type N-terminal cleavage/methylation domain-containing protein
MHYSNKMVIRTFRGFTIIELLVVIAIIVVLVSILTPSLGRAFRSARSAEDKTQAKGVYSSMLLYSTTNDGKLPLPSEIGKRYQNIQHDDSDTTANLMSYMLAHRYFNTDFLISPTESNLLVQDMDETAVQYDHDSVDGDSILWDTNFIADISSATLAAPANNSYAHQGLCGERVRLKWHAGASPSDINISNRGPEIEVQDGVMTEDPDSTTLEFHGRMDSWLGVIVGGDGSSRLAQSVYPDGVSYKPLNGLPLGPDNIFYLDWNDINVPSVPNGMASGDNWLVICSEVISENEINVVWD